MDLNSFAIMVFTKEPELGKVKTRLAASVGEHAALRVYTRMLEYTNSLLTTAITDFQADIHIFWAEEPSSSSVFTVAHTKHIQNGNNLGERMQNAFEKLLQHYSTVLIIGGDCLELQISDIQDAKLKSETADIVIGPANDGGYYCLCMRSPIPEIFSGIEWSTPLVLKQTLEILNSLHKSVFLLEKRVDVDTLDDLIASKAGKLILE